MDNPNDLAILSNPNSPAMRLRGSIFLLVLTVNACKEKGDSVTDSAGTSAMASAPAAPTVKAMDGSFSVVLPSHWAGTYRVDTLST